MLTGCTSIVDMHYESMYGVDKTTYEKYEALYQEMVEKEYVCKNHRKMFASMIGQPCSTGLMESCADHLEHDLGKDLAMDLCSAELQGRVYLVDDFKNTATDSMYGINGCVYSRDFVDSFIVLQAVDNIYTLKSKQEYENLEKSVKKRFGYSFCPNPSIEQYISRHEVFPKNCVTYTNRTALRVMQQVPDGTLCQSPYVSGGTVVLVQKNEKISQMIDGSLFNGYFIGMGTYQYTNVLGAVSTIPKIKFLGN